MELWQEAFSVKIHLLDEQHKLLFSLINDLHRAIEKGKTDEVSFIITELSSYALYHFVTEERLLNRYGYPDFKNHRNEHRRFEDSILEFRKRFMDNDLSLPREMEKFLIDWISSHILKTDSEYVSFLQERGLS